MKTALYAFLSHVLPLEMQMHYLKVTSSGILKAKQKLGVNFDLDKEDFINFTKFSKMTMCRTSEANS